MSELKLGPPENAQADEYHGELKPGNRILGWSFPCHVG